MSRTSKSSLALTGTLIASVAAGMALTDLAGRLWNPPLTQNEPLPFGPICRADTRDFKALIAALPPGPSLTLDAANALVNTHTGAGPRPVLEAAQGGLLTLRYIDQAGKSHREDGPARTIFDPKTGRVVMELWYYHGQAHRAGGLPASTEWDNQGRVTEQTFYEFDRTHNVSGSAIRVFDWKNDRLTEMWNLKGDTLREGGLPTKTISVISSGTTIFEEWASRIGDSRLMHRADGLHRQYHDPETGTLTRKLYRFHDMQTHSDERVYDVQLDRLTGLPQHEIWMRNMSVLGEVRYGPQGETHTPDATSIATLRAETKMLIQSGAGAHDHHDHGQKPEP